MRTGRVAAPPPYDPGMVDSPSHGFAGHDGTRLAYREIGEGRPLILLHGFLGTGRQWLSHGPAADLAGRGHHVILPDLRGHGESARPADPERYPPDILALDWLALAGHLGLEDYDLGGYSLGARVVLRMLIRGVRPGRAVLAGQGLDILERETARTGTYRRMRAAMADGGRVEPGSPEAGFADWISSLGGDPRALRRVLDTHVATERTALCGIATPVLVVAGDADHGHATAEALAAALPDARFVRVLGDHVAPQGTPEFADAIAAFLACPPA